MVILPLDSIPFAASLLDSVITMYLIFVLLDMNFFMFIILMAFLCCISEASIYSDDAYMLSGGLGI